jgi:hypothetical protein
MMRPTKIALLSLVLVPAVALAQRGGGGGGSKVRGDPKADWNSVENANKGVKLSNRDLENISPIKLLIDKKKDLKLSDDQVNKLKELDGKLKETNDPSFKVLDSLRRAAQPPGHQRGRSDDSRQLRVVGQGRHGDPRRDPTEDRRGPRHQTKGRSGGYAPRQARRRPGLIAVRLFRRVVQRHDQCATGGVESELILRRRGVEVPND